MSPFQRKTYVIAVLITCENLLERLKLPAGHKVNSVYIELRRERKRIQWVKDAEEALV